MRRGRLEEIDDEDDPSINVSNSQSSHIIYEKEEKIKIDYTSLNSSLTVSDRSKSGSQENLIEFFYSGGN